jgi:pimeloyl-ACP methyl ester carboxylesterase
VIPLIVVGVTAALTLKSDTKPVVVKVNKPRGTIYWGGAGLDGGYIADQLSALQEAGIKYVYAGRRTYGMPVDALRSGSSARYRGGPADEDWKVSGMESNPSSQFNMIGYSYGSLLAAQTAYFYASNGHVVDHLALVGSPIDEEFLAELRRQKNIKKVIVKDLREYGDPLFAGMSQVRLLLSILTLGRQIEESESKNEGIGHFYYARATREGNRRRRELAVFLYRLGLR